MRILVEEYHTTTFTFKEESQLILEDLYLNKDFYKKNRDHTPYISWTCGKLKEYQKNHLNILEVCTIFFF